MAKRPRKPSRRARTSSSAKPSGSRRPSDSRAAPERAPSQSPERIPPAPEQRFFATAPKGVEGVLGDELNELGVPGVNVQRGGVGFDGELEAAYRVCLWSRLASRVLMPVCSFLARNAQELYDGVSAVPWHEHLGPEQTMAVDVAGRNAPAGPPHFVALKTKDAVVDRIRAARGGRPSIDTEFPDLRIHVHLSGPRVTVSLDLAGDSLHRRGIARSGAKAPLKENLASAVLRLAGWPEKTDQPLYDPFCGSGTLLIEAAWMALDVAPGLRRGRIGAEGWLGHDAKLWYRLLDEAEERRALGAKKGGDLRIFGTDGSEGPLKSAKHNLRRADLDSVVQVQQRDFRHVVPPVDDPGLFLTNPPYGARLGDAGELLPLYEAIGDVLKQRFPGWVGWILCGELSLAKRIGLRPASRTVLYNGPIECRLLEIPISDRAANPGGKPGWRKPGPEAEAFAKKLKKNWRKYGKWVKREGLTCYRLYGSDMRQFNLSVDWYDGWVRVEEYYRPKKISAIEAEKRLQEAMQVIPEALGVDPDDVVLRVRKKVAPGEQHERRDDRGKERTVREGDLKYWVNLEDYLDTGLFMDDREIRRRIRHDVKERDFLNLFSYSCTASVAAAKGGARRITSVDLSNTYLSWGRRNFRLNGLDPDRYTFQRADVLQWLERGGDKKKYDLIFVAPPSYSRSKGMRKEFDIQRDHVWMLKRCASLPKKGGEILFTTNLRDFELYDSELKGWKKENLSEDLTPFDFAQRPRLKIWSFQPPVRS